MKRLSKAVILTATAGATVLGAAGGALAHGGGHEGNRTTTTRTTHHEHTGALAKGAAAHSPGVLSGNVIEVPVDVPIEVCGDTISVIGVLNTSAGNVCIEE
ncbi:chaplin [Streptomyces palmae]|uniref:Chaplin n=1 Tax=Streptomyces palmae TaxID=1701085 RepID=A0A4Z0H5U1_9ACTN|nr:chaplin [Streptomyces palmae]TGB07218.1 chaplin [Streptomyces palmae]